MDDDLCSCLFHGRDDWLDLDLCADICCHLIHSGMTSTTISVRRRSSSESTDHQRHLHGRGVILIWASDRIGEKITLRVVAKFSFPRFKVVLMI